MLASFSCTKDTPIDPPDDTIIHGRVVDENGLSIEGASVTTSPSIGQTTTGKDGGYTFNLGVSPTIVEYTFTAFRSGYQSGSTKLLPTSNKTVTAGDITVTTIKPKLEVHPSSITMGTSATSETVTLSNTLLTGSIEWTATSSELAWLSANPSSGTIASNGTTVISVDRNAVQPGNHTGIIVINGGAAGSRSITVTMTKQNPNAPQLSVTQSSLTFQANETQKGLNINNSGTGILNWTISSAQSWITFDSTSGSTASGTATSLVIVTVNKASLPNGQSLGKITVQSTNGGGTQELSVTAVKAQDFGSVFVTVNDETGPLSDADVYLSDDPAVSRGKTVGGNLSIMNIPTGTGYTVTAKKTGYIPNTSSPFVVTKDQATPVSLSLSKVTGSIAGKVTLEDGVTLIPNVTVKVFPADALDINSADGVFSFNGLKSGVMYRVHAVKANYDTVSSVYAAIGTNDVVLKLKLQSGTISGTVMDSLSNVGIQAIISINPNKGVISQPNAIGEYSISGLPAGTYVVTASMNSYVTKMVLVNVTNGGVTDLSVLLVPSFIETMGMVYVKGGTYLMGFNDNDEWPLHSVTLSDFYVGKFEVTEKRWREVVQWKQGSATTPLNPRPGFLKGDSFAVDGVSWNAVQTWMEYLNEREGLVNSPKKYRLLTESEWEYAARGGKHWQDGYTFSGSNTIDQVAWFSMNSGNLKHTVGTKIPNQLGVYDMTGNVEEWCSDWYGTYTGQSQTDPTGPANGTTRILRGGRSDFSESFCRNTSRFSAGLDVVGGLRGFRIAKYR